MTEEFQDSLLSNKNTPLVSVCMITYNHEKYIAEAIEGVLMQEVDFDVELIIADDASKDNTSEIIKKYVDNHPKGNWIKYNRHRSNLGMMPNFIWALEACQGKYVALCEGDDFWNDPSKLKKQIEFLEKNTHFVLTYHPVDVLFPDGRLNKYEIGKKYIKISKGNQVDLSLYGNFIHTPSVVFKKNFRHIPKYFKDLEVGDFFLYLFICDKGKFSRQDFKGAVYRYGVGTFTSESLDSIRSKFKKSLLIASKNQNHYLIRMILMLRVHQDNLYSSKKIIYKGISCYSIFDLISAISFIQIAKAVYKAIFRIETSKLP